MDWYAPTTLTDLIALQQQFATAAPGTVKYVCGNTAYGVEKYFNGLDAPTPYTVRLNPIPKYRGVGVPHRVPTGSSSTHRSSFRTCLYHSLPLSLFSCAWPYLYTDAHRRH